MFFLPASFYTYAINLVYLSKSAPCYINTKKKKPSDINYFKSTVMAQHHTEQRTVAGGLQLLNHGISFSRTVMLNSRDRSWKYSLTMARKSKSRGQRLASCTA